MTLVSQEPVSAASSDSARSEATVCAVVYATAATPELDRTLRALSRGTVNPEHVLVLDASAGDVAQLLEPGMGHLQVPADGARAAYNRLLSQPDLLPQGGLLWFLEAGFVPAPDALQVLVDHLRRSTSAAVVGPKLLDEQGLIRSLGINSTRSGRVMPIPMPGEPDQGQHDGRTDVLAVPAVGMLVRRGVFEQLTGFQPRLRGLGADLDFGWRAQRAGQRVLVAPTARATVLGPTLGSVEALTTADRRDTRRVALARGAWWASPLLALWIVAASLGGALILLITKRPAAALREASDVGAVLTPLRTVAMRWYARGTASIRRADMSSLFISTGAVSRHVADLVAASFGAGVGSNHAIDAPTDGMSDEDVVVDRGSLLGRIVKNPGVLAVTIAFVAGLVAARTVGGLRHGLTDSGFTGGELLAARTGASGLFHSWWDGWSGSGFGAVGDGSPAALVVAVLALIVGRVPLLGAENPGGVALAWIIALAIPAAAVTAYVAGRVVTRDRLLRGAVALGYACSAVAVSSVSHGRVGAVVALVLLPLVLAGFARTLSAAGSNTSAAATVLVTATLASFVPGMLLLSTLVAAAAVAFAPAGRRLRGLILLLGTPILLGPWVLTLLRDPIQFFGGPGLIVNGDAPTPLRLALLSPDPGSQFWWTAAPVLLLALVALAVARGRSLAQWALLALALLGIAGTVASGRISLGVVPDGQPQAGLAIHPWWGMPMMLTLAAAFALILIAFSGLTGPRTSSGRSVTLWPVAALLGVSALGLPALMAWQGLGAALSGWSDPRPAIAIDQANGPLGNRTLLLTPGPQGVTQKVIGLEAGPLARGLDRASTDAAFIGVIRDLLDTTGGDPAAELMTRGVGFVGLAQGAPADLTTRLDATGGLTRMGSRGGYDYWRLVPPAAPGGGLNIGVPRVALRTAGGVTVIPVSGPNARVDARVTAKNGDVLTVAAPAAWADVATVESSRGALKPLDGPVPSYAVAPGAQTLDISTPSGLSWLHWIQVLAGVVLAFLAIPAGRRTKKTKVIS